MASFSKFLPLWPDYLSQVELGKTLSLVFLILKKYTWEVLFLDLSKLKLIVNEKYKVIFLKKKSDKSPGCVSQAEGCLIIHSHLLGHRSLLCFMALVDIFCFWMFPSDKALHDTSLPLGWQDITVISYWTSCIINGPFHLWTVKRGRSWLSMKLPKSLSWFLCSDFQCFTAFWKPCSWKHVSSRAAEYDTVNNSHGWQDSSWDCWNWWHLDCKETWQKRNWIDYFS